MKTLTDYLNESLLTHIALELKDVDIIYEKYGEYDGCEDLAKYIINKLKTSNYENLHITYHDVKDISNIVFDNLYIIFNESKSNTASYVIPTPDTAISKNNIHPNYEDYSVIDEKTKRFKNCLIIINAQSFRNNSLESLIEHELTHMFNDYKIQAIGLTSFFDLFNNDAYKRAKDYKNHKNPLRVNELRHAIYMMNKYEKNSFIAQLCSEIRELKTQYEKINAKQIYQDIKSLDIYKGYMSIGDFINDYDNDALTEREKNYIINEWKELYGTELNLHQIFKILKRRFINVKQKLESIIPKKIAEAYAGWTGVVMDESVDLLHPYVL